MYIFQEVQQIMNSINTNMPRRIIKPLKNKDDIEILKASSDKW